MKTIWTYGVRYGHNGGMMSSCSPTLSEALAGAFRDCAYYFSLGYDNVAVTGLEERCAACGGDGTVLGDRFRRIQCKDCRGEGIVSMFPGFRVVLDKAVRITNTACEPDETGGGS